MGKGRDKRRRKTKRKEEVRTAKPRRFTGPLAQPEPLGGEAFGPFDPYAPVLAPLKPKPSLRSGAIALPQPEEPELSPLEAVGVKLTE